MKASATAMSICLTLFFLSVGCSREEAPPPPTRKAKVVKPVPQRPGVLPPPAEGKPGDEARERVEAEIASLEEAIKALGPVAGGEAEVEDIVRHHEPKPAPGPTETLGTGEGKKPKIEAKKAPVVETAHLEDKGLKKPVLDLGKEVEKMAGAAGHFVVWEADTLPSIAAREDVMGDPLKWPVLYRLNMDMLGALNLENDFSTKVPAGFKLKVLTPDKQKANLEKQIHNIWIVNVLSSPAQGKIAPPAIKLIKNGYKVYIARAQVKGKEWMRLRVGFFPNRDDANRAGEKIRVLLNLADSWVTRADKKELQEFGSL